MIQKSTTRACIVTLLIISSIAFSGATVLAQTSDYSVNTSAPAMASAYDTENDLLIVAEGDDAIDTVVDLVAYDQNGNEVWRTSNVAQAVWDVQYSPDTGLVYLQTFDGTINIRVYDSDGDYQGGVNADDLDVLAIDNDYGTEFVNTEGANTFDLHNWQIRNASVPFNTKYTTSTSRIMFDTYEPEKWGVTLDGVYNYETGGLVTSLSLTETTQYESDDVYEMNGDYVAGPTGLYRISDGSKVRSWGEVQGGIAIHPENGIAYVGQSDGTVNVYGAGGFTDTINLPGSSGFIEHLSVQEFNGDNQLIFSDRGSNTAGYVPAITPPSVSGTVKKSVQNTVSPLPNANVTLYDTNGNYVTNTTTDGHGEYEIITQSGDYEIVANKSGFTEESANITLSGDVTQNFTLRDKSALFNFKVANWMKHGDTTPYSATFEGGGYTKEPVTDEITVTSENTSIVSVDSENNSLVATSNVHINNRTNVTATYVRDGQEYEETQQVTVANRTIDNIEIMPPEQWVPTVLGFGEEGTVFGLGSEIQWMFVSIFTGGAAAWLARNEWMGIGVIVGSLTLFWALGNIDLGIMLVAVAYAAFAGYQLNRIPSRSDTNVGGNLGNQEQEYSRPADRYQE